MKSLLGIFPVETVDNIVEYLPTRDANNFAQTCWAAYWRADPRIWKDNVPTSTKPGPITWGVVTRQMKVIKKAVEAGADVNAPDWLACFHIPERCDNRADEWSLAKAASNDANGSPLHFAAMTNNFEAAEYLLQKGATLHDTRPRLDNWALNMCSCHWVDETWHWPRKDSSGSDEDSDEDSEGEEELVKHHQEYFTLPLHTAVCHKSLEVANLFLEHGASVYLHGSHRYAIEAAGRANSTYRHNDFLHILVRKGPDYLPMIDFIAQCPDIDIDGMEYGDATPLLVASSTPQNAAVIAKLAELGAMESWDTYSQDWIHCCIRSGMYDNALALLEAGLHASNPEVSRVIRSDAALIFADAVAFEAGWEESAVKHVKPIIRMLVQDYGLKLNAPLFDDSTNDETPLEYLIGGNCPRAEYLIQLLVDLGARLDLRNREGHNPLVRYLWVERVTNARKTKAPKTPPNKGIREVVEAGSLGSGSVIRQPVIHALIQAYKWANIRLYNKYTWEENELTLCEILKIRFPRWGKIEFWGWEPLEGSENNRALWKNLDRYLVYSHVLGFDFDCP
ncbi:ankyrin repeat-containing domain protein [Copromyces sp. CBS 386.78]|nr:ankyrin repeat-containing domain protein [Copromyces sp. CBS 386.78]